MKHDYQITKDEADRLYEHFNKNCESQMFFEELIDRGAKHVEMIWDHGKIEIKTFIEEELVAYTFNPYDIY